MNVRRGGAFPRLPAVPILSDARTVVPADLQSPGPRTRRTRVNEDLEALKQALIVADMDMGVGAAQTR